MNVLRHILGLLIAIAAVGSLAACTGGDGGSDGQGLPAWRQQVRSTAAEQIPKLATSLDANADAASGRYLASGGGLSSRTFAYAVSSQLTGATITAKAMSGALTDLGYKVVTTKIPHGTVSVQATKDDLSVLSSVSVDGSAPTSVEFTSPQVKVPKAEVERYESSVKQEPLTLH